MPIKPDRLNPDDIISILAPASPPPDPGAIDQSVERLKALGFRPKLARNVRQRHGFLAGTDRQRASDIMSAFADKRVKAIFCIRGGYGASRLLSLLDYRLIRDNPKIFIGYSDVTSLHCALLKKSGLVSFHGPMLNSELIRKDLPKFTLESVFRTLTQPKPPGSITRNYHDKSISVLCKGKASGPLLGGNLSLLCATIGTSYLPSFRKRILFLEDLEEPPYRFDRMLTHLWNAGLLQQVAGVAVGINRGCIDPRAHKAGEYRQTLEDVLKERLSPLKIPIVAGLPFGHIPHNATLPVGVVATLNASRGELSIDEAAVR